MSEISVSWLVIGQLSLILCSHWLNLTLPTPTTTDLGSKHSEMVVTLYKFTYLQRLCLLLMPGYGQYLFNMI